MRIAGACAVKHKCSRSETFYVKLKRDVTDIDLISLGKYRGNMLKFFKGIGYAPNERFNLYHGRQRQIYDHGNSPPLRVDVFFDELFYCHVIDFRNRLEADYPTIPLAELALEKNQIVKITVKDLKDTVALFESFPVGGGDMEMINGRHIAKVMAGDWGFYYTFTENLGKVRAYVTQLDQITSEETSRVTSRIDELLAMIENEPKTLAWKIRAKVGTKKKWYSEVDEVGGRIAAE